MKISVFTLADYVTEQAGKLIIVGAFDTLRNPVFPFVANPFGVAIKGYVEKNDYGKQREIAIEIKSKEKKIKVFKAIAIVKFPQKLSTKVDTVTLKFMLGNIEFKSPAVYVVECKTGGRILSAIQFEVVRISEAAASKKGGKKVAKKKVAKKR